MRYVNPHMQHPHQQHPHQQQYNQQLRPNQEPTPEQLQIMRHELQNQLQMIDGMQRSQQMRFQQGNPYQQQYGYPNQQAGQYVPANQPPPVRFTSQENTTQTHTTDRYSTIKKEEIQVEESNLKLIPFSVKPTQPVSTIYKKVELSILTKEIDPASVVLLNNKTGEKDPYRGSLDEAVNSTTETSKLMSSRLCSVENVTIVRTFYLPDNKFDISDLFMSDVVNLYSKLSNSTRTALTKEQIVIYDYIDDVFTKLVNEYLITDTELEGSIDSFMLDFNDLLKHIRSVDSKIEDEFVAYLNKFVDSVFLEYAELSSADNPLINRTVTTVEIGIPTTIAVLNNHILELGIESIDGVIVLENTVPNSYLRSLCFTIRKVSSSNKFTIVTIDRTYIDVTVNKEDKICISVKESL